MGTKEEMVLEGYTDADWAGDNNGRKSTSGCIFKLGAATIHYCARKQNLVTLSSTEAELVALTEASQEPKLYVDNQSSLKMLDSERINSRSRDLKQSGSIIYVYLSTEEMIADILTKPLSKIKFCKFKILLGLQ